MKYEVKANCFAYNSEKNECDALRKLYCKKQKCAFYKTEKGNIRDNR